MYNDWLSEALRKKAATAHFCQTIRDQDAMVHQQKRCMGLQDFHGAFFPVTLFLTAGAVQNDAECKMPRI
jgi:hypothetical protein